MQPVPLSLFVDFMLMAGTGRIHTARAFKKTGETSSFYKPFIDAIVQAHEMGQPLDAALAAFVATRTDERDRRMFTTASRGYTSFLEKYLTTERGSNEPTWFIPPMRDWPLGPLHLRVVPEIGLILAGKPHVLKLYLRADPINPQQIAITTTLLTQALQTTWPGSLFGVLDVRRSRMFIHRQDGDLVTLAKAEAMVFSTLYSSVDISK